MCILYEIFQLKCNNLQNQKNKLPGNRVENDILLESKKSPCVPQTWYKFQIFLRYQQHGHFCFCAYQLVFFCFVAFQLENVIVSGIHRGREAGYTDEVLMCACACVRARACVRGRKTAEHARVFACDNMVGYVCI